MSDLNHIYFAAAPVAPRVRKAYPAFATPGFVPRNEAPAEELNDFLIYLLQASNIDSSIYRVSPLKRRIAACLRALGVHSIEEARELLEADRSKLPIALDAIVIGVSSFFRDASVFALLEHNLIPELLRHKDHPRVFSAGCSAGQELYSIAALLHERQRLEGSYLLGMDCRENALDHARAGLFDFTDLAEIRPALRDKYFVPFQKNKFQISPVLHQRIQWRRGDLMHDPLEMNWDLVLFRNVGIYMNPQSVHSLWEKLIHALAPGGIIITGKSERPAEDLPLTRIASCIYKKRG